MGQAEGSLLVVAEPRGRKDGGSRVLGSAQWRKGRRRDDPLSKWRGRDWVCSRGSACIYTSALNSSKLGC